MDFNKYINSIPYPERVRRPFISNNASLQDVRDYVQKLEEYEVVNAAYREKKEAWGKAESERLDSFKRDALDELGLANHPKADRIYNYAWDKGHSYGITEVWSVLSEIAELFD